MISKTEKAHALSIVIWVIVTTIVIQYLFHILVCVLAKHRRCRKESHKKDQIKYNELILMI